MQLSKLNLFTSLRFLITTQLVVLLFMFQACKKADIPNSFDKNSQVAASKQSKDFFIISENAPEALKAIVKEMQKQLKQNDVENFLKWHGQPVWSKIIKFEKDKNGSVTYAIPTQKNAEITGFFAATIGKSNEIKFEMHRKTAIALKKGEYSYANITLDRSKTLLDYFNGKSKNVYESAASETTNSYWTCYWEWIEVTTLQEVNGNQQNLASPPTGYWLIICIIEGGGGGGTGGGDPGGGGTGGCGGIGGGNETFTYKWWTNESSLLSPCQLLEAVNRLSRHLGLGVNQLRWLLDYPERTEELDRYVGGGTNQQKNQIAYEHLDEMMTDNDYLNFVWSHAQTGDPLIMWWEDDGWLELNLSFNINEGVPNAPTEGPTAEEIALTKLLPIQAWRIHRNAAKATAETITRFGANNINDKSDAFRHAFWLALNTKYVGAGIALLFSNAHETENPPQFILEETMDLHNNSVGISLCTQSSLSVAYLAQAAMNAVTAGALWYLYPINYGDPCFWGCSGNSSGTHGITTQTQLKTTNQ